MEGSYGLPRPALSRPPSFDHLLLTKVGDGGLNPRKLLPPSGSGPLVAVTDLILLRADLKRRKGTFYRILESENMFRPPLSGFRWYPIIL